MSAATHPSGVAGRLRQWAQREYAVPALAALLLVCVGIQVALTARVPSWANDEPAHVGYIAALAEGRLPTIDTDIVDDPARFPKTAVELRGWDEAHGDIWTANHPPLFHLAMVPVWWVASDHQSAMVVTMRLANTAGFAGWLVMVFVLARELMPRRPAIPALAVVMAAVPSLVYRSGYLLTDGLAGTAALLLLWATIRLLRGDPSPRWVALATVAGVVAAGTRAQGVLVVGICTVALGLVLTRRTGWRRGIGVATVVGGVPAVAFGWFYLRNIALYGDLTGQDALMDKFSRGRVTSWSQIPQVPSLDEATFTTLILVVMAVTLVPVAVVLAVRAGRARLDAAWVLLIVHLVITVANVVTFIQSGGGFHDRYLMQAMPLLATVLAVAAVDSAHWWRRPQPGTPAARRRDAWATVGWAILLLAWLAGAVAWLEDHHIFRAQSDSPVDGVVPDLFAVLAVCAGIALVGVLVLRATRPFDSDDEPAADPRLPMDRVESPLGVSTPA